MLVSAEKDGVGKISSVAARNHTAELYGIGTVAAKWLHVKFVGPRGVR